MKVYSITEHYDNEKPNTELVIYDNLPIAFKQRIKEAEENNNISRLPELNTEEEQDAYVDNNSIQYLYKLGDKKFFAKPGDNCELMGHIDFIIIIK